MSALTPLAPEAPAPGGSPRPAPTRGEMVRVVLASTLGTTIEWYDFFLYGTVAALVFPKLFFPTFDPFVGTLLSLTTFLIGFIARPLGGVVFGHLGDRVGRKSTLVATLLLMGGSTLVIGLVPGYRTLGVWAPVLVSVMRFLQGFGVGGEWGGSVLLALEYGHGKHRGFWASFPQAGVPLGLLLSSLAVSFFAGLTGNAFEVWGWRIPFYLSVLLIALGLWIRLRIVETPLFREVKAKNQASRVPALDVLREHRRDVLLTASVRFAEQAPFYLFATFVVTYGVQHLGVSRRLVLTGINLAALLEIVTIPLFSYVSDRVGRRAFYLVGCVLMLLFAFPYYWLLQTRRPVLVVLAIVLSLAVFHAWLYGPLAALISERFRTGVRYSGASMGYQLAAPFAGGLAPLIAESLLRKYDGAYAPLALYIIALSVVSFVATWQLSDLTRRDIST